MSIRIAILLSGRHGRGSNMQAIADACRDGRIAGQVALVIGNQDDSPAIARARSLDLPTQILSSPPRDASPADEDQYAARLHEALSGASTDLICLAGYLRKLPGRIVQTWSGKILNTHPALLPAFGGQGMYGLRVHQAALDYGVKVSGCTVHIVDEAYDTGPIVLQVAVPVEDDDTAETLARRILTAEHEAYPRAVALFSEGRICQAGRRTFSC